jgi:hypothetical protein
MSLLMIFYRQIQAILLRSPALKILIFSSAVVLALVSILLMPLAVDAVSTDTTTLSGTVGASITVTSPENITMPPLVAGNSVTSAAQTVTIVTNTSGWSLAVADTGTDEQDGRLSKADGTDLYNVLEIKGGDLSSYFPLSSSQILKNSGSSGTVDLNNIMFQQSIPSNAIPGEYKITLTFTASPGN